jgi:exodeoxyribonuclease V beta subunit
MNPDFHPHLAYSASAGSGKTFALSARYIALLFMGESPASILAATFTNKAAAEMRQRVVDSLRGLGEKKNAAFVTVIAEQTGLSREELLSRQPQILTRFLSSPNHIVTLDSFFASILRSSSLEIGLEPTFATREADPKAIEERFLGEVRDSGLLHTLAQLAHQIEDKRFSKILGLMHHFYTVDPLLPDPTPSPHATLKQTEEQIESNRLELFEALEQAGTTARALKQFQTGSAHELFAKNLWEHTALGDHSWFKKVANAQIEHLFTQLRETLGRWAQQRETAVLEHLFALYDHYRNTLIGHAKAHGVLSFDDLTYFTYRLLYESIDREFLYFKIDARFHHILLDEFQDTSTLQFLLLKPLIDEIFAGEGQSELRTFFYVGDTKQSLYRFRGGVEELFDQVARAYNITIQPMDTNYRSSRHVVHQVNQWFAKTMPDYQEQNAKADALSGYVHVLETESVDDLTDAALTRTIHLHEKGIDWDDMAILVHTNKDGQTLQESLLHEGIPTRLKTSSSLRTQPKIAALVAMIEYLYRGAPIDAEAMLERIGTSLSDIHIKGYTAFMSPMQIVDRLIREMGYFDDDPNLLKLLEFTALYDDIAIFLDEFATSNIALAAHTVHGVQIMTIHGSKGLEFDHVIVLDRLTRPRPDTAPLFFDYRDDLSIERIFYRMKGRDHFDPHYATILQHQKTATDKDRLNLLYVALTRAATGLTIIRKPKESIFDPIGIQPLTLGTIKQAKSIKDSSHLPTTHYPLPTLRNYGYQEKPAKEEEEDRDHEAILFGTALHYGLEMLPAFDAEAIEPAIDAMRNRYGRLLRPKHIDEIRDRIARLIADTAFQTFLQGATVRREQSIAYKGDFKQIDLLIEYPDHCLVIDYKSSTKYATHHQSQVRHYVRAIEKILGKPTKGKIVYLLKHEIVIQET